KLFKVISTFLIVLFFISQIFIYMSIFKTEQQKYTVIKSDPDFEIRFYPSATLATIQMNVKSYKELSNSGFRTLAGYIFGGNESRKNISMTAPVHMNIKDTGSSMSFVMPEQYTTENLPKPNNTDIVLTRSEDEYVAVVTFGGYSSDEKIKANTEKLISLLQKNGIAHKGNFRYLGYNPPYQLFGRRNEIIVTVDWNNK
ncbi:MAG TPA: heme-binding protein, partial [Chitinophagales bacterium]|nr:heme-binding protein [Chitinophagales bacterium]